MIAAATAHAPIKHAPSCRERGTTGLGRATETVAYSTHSTTCLFASRLAPPFMRSCSWIGNHLRAPHLLIVHRMDRTHYGFRWES